MSSFELSLVGPRVDNDQHCALFDLAPLGEIDGRYIPRDTRPQLHSLDSLEVSRELIEFGNRPGYHLRDADLWRWRRTRPARR